MNNRDALIMALADRIYTTPGRVASLDVRRGWAIELAALAQPDVQSAAISEQEAELVDYRMAADAEAAEVDRRGVRIKEQEAEIARLRADNERLKGAFVHWYAEWVGKDRALNKAVGLSLAVLTRDGGKACHCISVSRKAEIEYESGRCPHQRLAAFLAQHTPTINPAEIDSKLICGPSPVCGWRDSMTTPTTLLQDRQALIDRLRHKARQFESENETRRQPSDRIRDVIDLIDGAANALAEQQAYVRGLEADAARYRQYRLMYNMPDDVFGTCMTNDEIDALWDAAISATAKGDQS